MPELPELTLWTGLALFVVAAAAVWVAGARLTRYADEISERTGFGRAGMGFLVLATATQLPEIATNATAAARGNAELVLNSMFGGITMQTAVLAAADLVAARYALTFLAEQAVNLVQGTILILLLALVLGVTILGDVALIGSLGVAPVALAGLYGLGIAVMRFCEKEQPWQARRTADAPFLRARDERDRKIDRMSLRGLVVRSCVAAGVILGAGVTLVHSAETVAARSGLGTSFIGVTLLASATSLPELSTTIAAVRLGRYSMAVSDVLGSNLIMVFLLLPSDALYTEGLLLDAANPSARFALVAGLVVTALYLIGLSIRRPRRLLGLGLDSWAVLAAYVASLFVLYRLR